MHITPILILGLCCACWGFSAAAERWVNASGQAEIQTDIDSARQEAIKQAITYASLSHGFTMSSQTTVSQGQLSDNRVSLQQQLQTQSMKLISEQLVGNQLQVTIALLLDDDNQAAANCSAAALSSAILIPQAQIADRSQLNYGQLVNFESELSKRLARQMDQHSLKTFAQLHSQDRLDIDNRLALTRGYRFPEWLGITTDSQYILQIDIDDMSLLPATSSLFGLMNNDPVRQFIAKFKLYHTISGERIWQQTLSSQAPWTFDRHQQVMPNSAEFWQSSYGQAIDKLLKDGIKELDNQLLCRPTLGQIVAVDGNRLMINLGRRHGLQVSDQLKIVLKQDMPDRLNGLRALAAPSQLSFKLDHISELSASGVLQQSVGATGIQVNDLVIKQ
ncbi:flagellar assembly protein T N-terminal domain-containing protein [Shewanella sp. NIFS-20-20]|uniref:flagellar assembly protein T N-terminal domain-containing protein n=1 Tax=Shewanella sp. NIFS-20-20 TaxID=2853806 RepID=UPI001C490BF0|nr:flagella assembly protein FlgT [Shewanella sp. NIFS-20-20]